jgi:serine/threonine protein kinase
MSSVPTEDRLGELLLRWDEMRRQGRDVSAGELCADCPELVDEVRRRIGVVRDLEPILNVEPTHLVPTPGDGDPDGLWADRRLPNYLHATAVYRPRRFHAQGGLGEVLAADQEELERTVALKRIRPDKLRDAARRRFLREAAITARLQHPGIVPIYGLGQDEDGPFYTMPFIEGRTLQQAIDAFHGDESLRRDPGRRDLGFRGLLQHYIAVCNTMAYAHDQGVIHRDLKPANIMLGPYGETLVMDWGLAKRLGAEDGGAEVEGDAPSPSPWADAVTAAGAVLGTLHYMSPEQARGEPASPASDVFSLGLVLYAILTGKSPYADASLEGESLRQAVREAAVVRPGRHDAGLPGALEAVCLKALAPRPEDRYSTARALADDLSRWLADEPVTAWREPLYARAWRLIRKHRTLTTTAAASVGVLLVMTAIIAVHQARSADRERKARVQIEKANDLLASIFIDLDPRAEAKDGKPLGAILGERLNRAAEQLDAKAIGDPLTVAKLQDAVGVSQINLGYAEKAIPILTRAARTREARLGRDHPTTLTSLSNLAGAYWAAARLDKAIPIQEETLKLRTAKLGPDHLDTLTSRNSLAVAYKDAGRLDEAVAMHETTLKLRTARLGIDHPDALNSRNNLAAAYRAAGRLDEAIAINEETLKLRRARLGPDHPDTLASRNNLAEAYGAAGRLDQVFAMHTETLKLYMGRLGPDHPDTLTIRNSLAEVGMAVGRVDEVVAMQEETLRLRESRLGSDHPATLMTRSTLAFAYRDLGRLSEAELEFRRSWEGRMRSLGPGHLLTIDTENHWGVCLAIMGRHAHAERHYLHTLEAIRKTKDVPADWEEIYLERLATLYDSWGMLEKATEFWRHAIDRRRKTGKPDSPLLAGALAMLGSNLLNRSKCSEAEPALRECLAICAKALPDDWLRFNIMSQLGGALLGQGRFAEAEPLVVRGYEEIKARAARIPSQTKIPRLSEAAERVVRLYEAWGKSDQAKAWKAKLGMPDLPADVFATP